MTAVLGSLDDSGSEEDAEVARDALCDTVTWQVTRIKMCVTLFSTVGQGGRASGVERRPVSANRTFAC